MRYKILNIRSLPSVTYIFLSVENELKAIAA